MKAVMLRIKGKQINEEGEENVVEMVTEGKFYKKGEAYYLVYDESELSGMEGSTTTLKILEKKIIMKRFGSNTAKLVFEKGQKHQTQYTTPYGDMPLEIITKRLDIHLSDSGKGTIELSYSLKVANTTETRNELSISIL